MFPKFEEGRADTSAFHDKKSRAVTRHCIRDTQASFRHDAHLAFLVLTSH